jgi:hypothetical protein
MEPEGSLPCPQEVLKLQDNGRDFPGGKVSVRQADDSPPSSAKVKNLHYLTYLHGFVLKYLNTGASLCFYSVQRRALVNTAMNLRVL